MDAAGLSDRVGVDGPGVAVRAQVPAHLEMVLGDHDVVDARVILSGGDPVPAVAGDDPGLVVEFVLLFDGPAQLVRVVEHPEVVLFRPRRADPGPRADAQQVVQPLDVAVRAVAAELRHELQLPRGRCTLRSGPLPDLVGGADVLQGHPLILVQEEHGGAGGVDDLLDLVLAQVGEQAALCIQPVGLVRQDGVERVGGGIDEAAGAAEHGIDALSLHRAFEPDDVDLPRGAVLAHIGRGQAVSRQLGQQVHGQHRLAGARAAPDDDDPLALAWFQASRLLQDILVDDLLVIDHGEGRVAADHVGDLVLQGFRRPQASLIDLEDGCAAVASADVSGDELAQLADVMLGEHRGLPQAVEVHRVGQRVVGLQEVVVQEGARVEVDRPLLHLGAEVLHRPHIGPDLVGGVGDLAVGAAEVGPHDGVLAGHLADRLPLLELDDDRRLDSVPVGTGDDHVDALLGVRDVVLEGDAGVIRDDRVAEHAGHHAEGVLPGLELAAAGVVAHLREDRLSELLIDQIAVDVSGETGLGALVDDHNKTLHMIVTLTLSRHYSQRYKFQNAVFHHCFFGQSINWCKYRFIPSL